ncbi:hypothetical protein [Piscinibacter sakaiensis]|uniref:hypothetical protein n=1 Tax=Piscinibacter sakaiensis TaxID=1547922 RepID=UPI003AAF6626
MSPLDAIWHLLNFFAPAVFLAVFTASVAKLLWRREWRAVRWRSLLLWALIPTLVVAVVGLVITGRDGMMITYVAMAVAAALGLWLAGLFRGRH